MNLPEKVTIIEVGPRDGLQNEQHLVDTEVKKAFIEKLAAAGVKEMEITSFVSPEMGSADAGMQLKSCDHVPRNSEHRTHAESKRRRSSTGNHCKSVAVFVGVSNSFNKKNINKPHGKVWPN